MRPDLKSQRLKKIVRTVAVVKFLRVALFVKYSDELRLNWIENVDADSTSLMNNQ